MNIKDILHNIELRIWIKNLRSNSWTDRVRAAEKLGEMKDRHAVEALIEALAGERVSSSISLAFDTDTSRGDYDRFPVREASAKALGLIGDPRAAPALIAALEDPMPPVQVEAVKALGLIGDKSAIEYLVVMLRSPYDDVRAETVVALARFGTPPVRWLVEVLRREAFESRQAAARALGLIGGPAAILALIGSLQDPDYHVRRESVEALVRIGKPAVEPLLPMLREPCVEAREAAITALGKIRDAHALDPLKQAVSDPDRGVREAVWHALELLSWPPAVTRRRIQRAIEANAYQRVKEEGSEAVEPLIETFRHADEPTRDRLAQALGDIGQPGIGSLLVFLKDMNLDVRRLSAKILGIWGWLPQTPEERIWLALAKGSFAQAVDEGPAAIPPLAAMLKFTHEWDREMAALSMGQIRDSRVVPLLVEVMNDPVAKVRRIAAEALGEAGGPLAEAALRAASEDPDYNVRGAVREALHKIGTQSDVS